MHGGARLLFFSWQWKRGLNNSCFLQPLSWTIPLQANRQEIHTGFVGVLEAEPVEENTLVRGVALWCLVVLAPWGEGRTGGHAFVLHG